MKFIVSSQKIVAIFVLCLAVAIGSRSPEPEFEIGRLQQCTLLVLLTVSSFRQCRCSSLNVERALRLLGFLNISVRAHRFTQLISSIDDQFQKGSPRCSVQS